MKHIKTHQFNDSETLAVISLYPHRGETYTTGVSGIASFAKNIVRHLDRKILVIAQQDTYSPSFYTEDKALVVRSYISNTYSMWIRIIRTLLRFPKISKVLMQFDFALYGGVLQSMLVVPFLLILKLLRYQTHIVLHTVVNDVHDLSGHVGLGKGWIDEIKAQVYNGIFHTFYRIVGVLTAQTIVIDESLVPIVKRYISNEKVICIPHGVDIDMPTVTKEHAREELGYAKDEHVVMYFGFVNWFKGADFFVDAFSQTKHIYGKKARFVIAGGESATLNDKAYYQKYFQEVVDKVSESKSITMTGFVPQDKINLYFAAADLIVFPYRTLMCASGVMSLTLMYEKPFIISKRLDGMLHSHDFADAMKMAGLEVEDISFAMTPKSCQTLTEQVLKNGRKQKLQKVATLLKEARCWQKNSLKYDQAIFAPVQYVTQSSTQDIIRPALEYVTS